jgi:hypothetical protein
MTNKALLTTCFVVVWRTRMYSTVVRRDHAERGRPVVRQTFGHENLMRTIGRSTLSHLSAGGRGRRHRPTSLSRYVLLATGRRRTIIANAYSCHQVSVHGCGRKYRITTRTGPQCRHDLVQFPVDLWHLQALAGDDSGEQHNYRRTMTTYIAH